MTGDAEHVTIAADNDRRTTDVGEAWVAEILLWVAQRLGFAPCLRLDPDQPRPQRIHPRQVQLIQVRWRHGSAAQTSAIENVHLT